MLAEKSVKNVFHADTDARQNVEWLIHSFATSQWKRRGCVVTEEKLNAMSSLNLDVLSLVIVCWIVNILALAPVVHASKGDCTGPVRMSVSEFWSAAMSARVCAISVLPALENARIGVSIVNAVVDVGRLVSHVQNHAPGSADTTSVTGCAVNLVTGQDVTSLATTYWIVAISVSVFVVNLVH